MSKRIFITGAASGIGRATALLFAEQGWQVGLGDLDHKASERLAGEIGPAATAYAIDVLDPVGLRAAMAAFADDSAGRLDALFNSAGILDMRRLRDTPLARQHLIVDVNIKGVLNSIDAALPYLLKAEAAHIVTMSSAAAVYGVPDEAVYSASKFAVRGLTEALNIELASDGIWVSDVMVSFVDTPMVRDAEFQAKSVEILGIGVQPTDVARTVWDATHGRQVHWPVTPEDADYVAQMAGSTPEQRRELMQAITGYASQEGA